MQLLVRVIQGGQGAQVELRSESRSSDSLSAFCFLPSFLQSPSTIGNEPSRDIPSQRAVLGQEAQPPRATTKAHPPN